LAPCPSLGDFAHGAARVDRLVSSRMMSPLSSRAHYSSRMLDQQPVGFACRHCGRCASAPTPAAVQLLAVSVNLRRSPFLEILCPGRRSRSRGPRVAPCPRILAPWEVPSKSRNPRMVLRPPPPPLSCGQATGPRVTAHDLKRLFERQPQIVVSDASASCFRDHKSAKF